MGFNGPLNASHTSSFDTFWAVASPWPLTTDLQPLTKCHWKTSGKFEAIILGQPHWGHFWPLTSYWGIKMLEQQKKVSVLHLSVCSFGDQSSQLILCLDRMYIFLNLDCPASVWLSSLGLRPRLDNYQTLAGQSRSRKMKILSRQRNFAIELCHLWAVLQMQHRILIPLMKK